MILVDSSAWIEFLRDTGSPVCLEVDRLIGKGLVVTDPILMEVLAGARDERHLHDLRSLLGTAHLASCGPADFLAAAGIYRRCRQGGETVRRLVDCLIAAVALRRDLPVLHSDADFEVLARQVGLRIHR